MLFMPCGNGQSVVSKIGRIILPASRVAVISLGDAIVIGFRGRRCATFLRYSNAVPAIVVSSNERGSGTTGVSRQAIWPADWEVMPSPRIWPRPLARISLAKYDQPLAAK